jgi:hypothetical protein
MCSIGRHRCSPRTPPLTHSQRQHRLRVPLQGLDALQRAQVPHPYGLVPGAAEHEVVAHRQHAHIVLVPLQGLDALEGLHIPRLQGGGGGGGVMKAQMWWCTAAAAAWRLVDAGRAGQQEGLRALMAGT